MSFWRKLFGLNEKTYSDERQSDVSPNFGYSKDDPIPCDSIPSAYWYLSRLVKNDGSPVKYRRIGSFGSDSLPNLIDGYELTAMDGDEDTIFIWPYADETSSQAPKGYTLLPANG